jgi:hypothetical protein
MYLVQGHLKTDESIAEVAGILSEEYCSEHRKSYVYVVKESKHLHNTEEWEVF